MGARIVSDFLYLDGWDIDFLGADLPAAELADFARKTHPDLVAISVVLSEDLSSLRDAVAQVKAAVPDAKVLVGGPAILDADEAMKLGAHGFATDAIGAAEMARALVGAPTGITLDQLLASLGEKVQIQRKSRAWKQQQLADLAGLDRTYVSAVENGKQNITISALHKLASAFEMPACWLLPED
jgi:DNA-binding XRE family transcriptional regulator/methylmalonyl-CoA mutase cobalamin-binding subunit